MTDPATRIYFPVQDRQSDVWVMDVNGGTP